MKNISSEWGWDDESADTQSVQQKDGPTRSRSIGRIGQIQEHIKLAVECGSESDITAVKITNNIRIVTHFS